jgi:hypothetical protein
MEYANTEELLRDILKNMRYHQPETVERAINLYRMNRTEYEQDHVELYEMLKNMFGPSQGAMAYKIFIKKKYQ